MKMVKGKLANLIAGIISLAFAGFVFFYSNTFPKLPTMAIGPDFFPKMLSIGLTIFTVAHLIVTLSTNTPKDFGKLSLKDPGCRRILICLAGIIVFAVLIKPLGFIPSAALYMLLMCYVLGMRNYLLMIIVSIAFPTAVALVFQIGLKIFLPAGILKSIL